MLTIRPEQLAVLAESGLVLQILEHLAEFFPDHCATLRPESLRAHVESAIARARSHGLTEGPHICLFVDLVFLFGHDFDSEPWAARILGDPALAARRETQMLCLRDAAKDRLAERERSAT
jgi:hypothetical protein